LFSRMHMRFKQWIVTGLVLSLTVIACKEEKKEEAPRRQRGGGPVQAEGFIVKTTSLSENIEVPGTLLPFEVTEIRPEISGRVVRLNIPEGSFVQKGSLLVKLFDEDLQAQLKKLEVQLQIAQKTAERYRELLKISGISQQEVDLSELQVNNLKADIELVKVNIGKTEIRAPYGGRIGLKSISLGAYISPSNLITTISEVSRLKMQFSVPEKYSGDMSKGRQVDFTIAGAGKKFKATILATNSTIEENTRTLQVLTVIAGSNPLLVPGSFAKVSLRLGEDNEAIIVPTQAIIPQARNKKVVIYRNGSAEFETVITGLRDSSFVQILEGVKPGDTIITTALLAIQPDSKIKLTKVQ
jgi:membrane fusion protein, multidrug efflux system